MVRFEENLTLASSMETIDLVFVTGVFSSLVLCPEDVVSTVFGCDDVILDDVVSNESAGLFTLASLIVFRRDLTGMSPTKYGC